MANTRELRRRIKSVKNTSQITKAMQMVSATKMRRAQRQALNGRPYTYTLEEVLAKVSGTVNLEEHRLLQPNLSTKTAVLVLTSDKGLCGSLNTNVLRKLQSDENLKSADVQFFTYGKKGRDFIVRTGKNLVADFATAEHIDALQAVKIRKFLVDLFLKEEIGQVFVLYPTFKSTLQQEPLLVRLLPVSFEMPVEKQPAEDFLYEPDAARLLDWALTHQIDTQIYQALLEMKASEHSARMVAMQNATDNALELVEDLTLSYNQIRQDTITKEILEIASGSAALE